MSSFDPDAYLNSGTAVATSAGFDPDAYLKEGGGPTGSPKSSWENASPVERAAMLVRGFLPKSKEVVPSTLGEMHASGSKPFIGYGSNEGRIATVPAIESKERNPVAAVAAGLTNAVGNTAATFTSPEALMPAGAAVKLFKAAKAGSPVAAGALRGMGVGFGAVAAHGAGEQAGEASLVLEQGDATLQEKTEKVAMPVISGTMALASGLSAVPRSGQPGATAPATPVESPMPAPSRGAQVATTARILGIPPREAVQAFTDGPAVRDLAVPAIKGSGLPKQTTTLNDLVGQPVRYEGYGGKLIRDPEGNFVVLREVVENGRPQSIEVAGTGKDATLLADSVGVVPEAGWVSPGKTVKIEVPPEAAFGQQAAGVPPKMSPAAERPADTPGALRTIPRGLAADESASLAPRQEGTATRGLLERLASNEDMPKEFRDMMAERTKQDSYQPQPTRSIAAELESAPVERLTADFANKESSTATLSGLELAGRALAEGRFDDSADLFAQLAERGTTLGQLVQQYAHLKSSTPEGVIFTVNRFLDRSGYDPLTPQKMTKLRDLSGDSILAARELRKADEAYLANPSAETWAAVQRALEGVHTKQHATAEYVTRVTPKNLGDSFLSVLQGNTLTPISQAFNLTGNALGIPFRASGRSVSAIVDAIDSTFIRKGPREITVAPAAESKAKVIAMTKALKTSGEIIARGQVTDHYEVGSPRASLNAFRSMGLLRDALVKAAESDLATKDGKVPMGDLAALAMESTIGLPADIMLRGLGAADAPFKAGERARIITEFANRKGLSPEDRVRATMRPELFFSRDDLKTIEFEAARAVYQQENAATNFADTLNNWVRRHGGTPGYALWRTASLYQRTPINVLGEVLTFNPPTGMVKLAADVKQARKTGNYREAKLTAGKIVVGSTISAVGYYLYDKGLLTPGYDDASDSAKQRAFGRLGGFPDANSINVSGLERLSRGEDPAFRPGDKQVDVTKLGVAGALLFMTANSLKRAEALPEDQRQRMDQIGAMLAKSPIDSANYAMNASFLRGANDLLKAIANDSVENWFASYVETATNAPLPATLAAVSRASREFKPDFTDDNAFKRLGNRLADKFRAVGIEAPIGTRLEDLPLKVDLWGRPIRETPEGANPYLYQFFDVTRGRRIGDDPTGAELYRLWRRTGSSDVIPSLPARAITYAGQKIELSPNQYERYAQLVGNARRGFVDNVIYEDSYIRASDSIKLRILEQAYDRGAEVGKAQLLPEVLGSAVN